MSSAPGRRFPDAVLDWLLLGALLAIAAAVRLPYLQLVPLVTDEAFEVLAALPILRGEWLLFGPVNPTAGPLLSYLLALGLWLFGPGMYVPRVVILVLGVLTVAAGYWLGRSMGGRLAGLLGGLLLAFCPIHVIVNSHVAWSNSASPLLAAATFAALHSGVRRHDGRLLILGGFFYGLALQTHISLLVAGPGLVAWFLLRRDVLAWLRRPWPYLAAAAALLAYGNMIAYNLLTGGGSIADFQQHTYAWVAEPSLETYWTNFKAMARALGLTVGGQVPRIDVPGGGAVTALLLAWLAAALVTGTRAGETMPLLVLLSSLLIMPYFNQRYEGLLSQRYTAFLLPLCYAAMGLAASRAFGWLRRRQALDGRYRRPVRVALAVATLLALFLSVYPLRATLAHYAAETAAGRDNRPMMAMARYVQGALPPATPLYVSANLRGERGDGGFRYLRAIYYYLTLEGVDHWVLDPPDLAARLGSGNTGDAWLLLPPEEYEQLASQYALEPIAGAPSVPNGGLLVRYLPPPKQDPRYCSTPKSTRIVVSAAASASASHASKACCSITL